MPGPVRLEGLLALLRAPDRDAILASLCREIVPGQTGPADTVVAIAWATADATRVSQQVVAPFVPLERDRLLGSKVTRVRTGRLQVLLAQPDRESGMAAFLSRFGEGVAAIYVERPGFLPPTRVGERPPRPVPTPLGRRGWLLPHDWPWGPFVIVLESASAWQG